MTDAIAAALAHHTVSPFLLIVATFVGAQLVDRVGAGQQNPFAPAPIALKRRTDDAAAEMSSELARELTCALGLVERRAESETSVARTSLRKAAG